MNVWYIFWELRMIDQSAHMSREQHDEQTPDLSVGTQIVLSQSRSVGGTNPGRIGINYDLTSPEGERVKGLFFFHPLQPYTVKMKPKWDDVGDAEDNTENNDEDITSCVVSIHQIMNGKQVYEALNVELHPDDATLFHEQVCGFIEPIVGRAFQGASAKSYSDTHPQGQGGRAQSQKPKQIGTQQRPSPQPHKTEKPRQEPTSTAPDTRAKGEGRSRSVAKPMIIGLLVMIAMVSAAMLYRVMDSLEYTGPAQLPNEQPAAPVAQPNALQPNFNEPREQPWTPN
jgi:hypothetical protein